MFSHGADVGGCCGRGGGQCDAKHRPRIARPVPVPKFLSICSSTPLLSALPLSFPSNIKILLQPRPHSTSGCDCNTSSATAVSMNHDHAPRPQTIRHDPSLFKQTLLPQSRETGEVVPPKQPDGAPVVATGSPFAKSWAHFIAGGYDCGSPRHVHTAFILMQAQARWNGVCDSDCPS